VTSKRGGSSKSSSPPTVSQAMAAEAERIARGWLLMPPQFWASVTKATERRETYSMCAHQIVRREVEFSFEPGYGLRKSQLGSLPDPDGIDPWQVDLATLTTETETACQCPICHGTKKVACGICEGLGRVRCGYCGGGGSVRGDRGLKNCPDCRGRGDIRCDECSRGRIRCETCDATGKVLASLTNQRVKNF
jgi:hypothetical protein